MKNGFFMSAWKSSEKIIIIFIIFLLLMKVEKRNFKINISHVIIRMPTWMTAVNRSKGKRTIPWVSFIRMFIEMLARAQSSPILRVCVLFLLLDLQRNPSISQMFNAARHSVCVSDVVVNLEISIAWNSLSSRIEYRIIVVFFSMHNKKKKN